MPTADQILEGLREVANDAFAIAVAWHAAIALSGIALAMGWRPSRRRAGLLLTLPAVSVSMLAWAHNNPFNGAVFALISVVLAMLAREVKPGPISFRAPAWAIVMGIAILLFGWSYPHFLEGRSAIAYLYGAPTGLIPCPTLSLMIGASLLVRGLDSRPWAVTLGLFGVFYALWGAIHLGVYIDIVLLAGAIGLLLMGARRHRA